MKVLTGTRSDRINRDEPIYPGCSAADLEPPESLYEDDRGRDHWGILAPLLAKAGILTAADRPMLAILCRCLGRLDVDPLDDKAIDHCRRLSAEFGLTPSSRSRIKVAGDAKPKDELGEFLKRKKSS